eukprot:6175140-Pleurochrysis_carterae.AAC.1
MAKVRRRRHGKRRMARLVTLAARREACEDETRRPLARAAGPPQAFELQAHFLLSCSHPLRRRQARTKRARQTAAAEQLGEARSNFVDCHVKHMLSGRNKTSASTQLAVSTSLEREHQHPTSNMCRCAKLKHTQ